MLKEKNKNNKLSKMISEIMDNLNAVIDTNSVVGKPLTTCDGSVVIPEALRPYMGGKSVITPKN